jgi:hypothetical protein
MRGYAKRAFGLSVAVGLVALAGPSSASAATQIGQTPPPVQTGCAGSTFIQVQSPNTFAAPFGGVITSWSHLGDAAPPTMKLKVGRGTGANLRIIGESSVQTPPANILSTFPTRIPIEAGDMIGLYAATFGGCADFGGAFLWREAPGDVPPGSPAGQFGGTSNDSQFDISASLEPDADNDGFGDETQDNCPGAPNGDQTDADGDGVGAACDDEVPPDTQLTKGPKDKTKKKQATFEFTSTEPGSIFECSLDGRTQFKACTSPLTVKVKKGKHTFSVQAIDQAGNADSSLATDGWKVKKKKRR